MHSATTPAAPTLPPISRSSSGSSSSAQPTDTGERGEPTATISITSTPAGMLSMSTITINAQQADQMAEPLAAAVDVSNSLASNVSQVTVVTSHPPVLVDNGAGRAVSPTNGITIVGSAQQPESPPPAGNDVIIVSGADAAQRLLASRLQQQQHEPSLASTVSTDEEFPSLDSLEFTPRHLRPAAGQQPQQQHRSIVIGGLATRARKLDESEVFIVNVEDDSQQFDDSLNDVPATPSAAHGQLDTSHVSVVTVGEQIHVKDSSQAVVAEQQQQPDDTVDEVSTGKRPLHNGGAPVMRSSSDDVSIIVNKKRPDKRIGADDSSIGSLGSRTPSESGGSMRSAAAAAANQQQHHHHHQQSPSASANTTKSIDRSDAESIATTASHDSGAASATAADDGVVIRRPKAAPASQMPALVPRSKEEIELRNLRKKTRKRTRKFEIDGVQVTTTTSRVIYGDDENGRQYDDHIIRKQEIRELKILQKQEKKQFLELQTKEQATAEQQQRRFEQEQITLERTYEADMDTLARQHKQLVEKTEQQQESDLRATSKRIRGDQERELKMVSVTNSKRQRIRIYCNGLLCVFFFSSATVSSRRSGCSSRRSTCSQRTGARTNSASDAPPWRSSTRTRSAASCSR